MTHDEIKQLTPQERVAGYLARNARISEVGARLRTKYKDVSTDYCEPWTDEEDKEWEDACAASEEWFYALTPEEKETIWPIEVFFGCLCRGEWPAEFQLKEDEKMRETAERVALIVRQAAKEATQITGLTTEEFARHYMNRGKDAN